jgi:hypothetical protein
MADAVLTPDLAAGLRATANSLVGVARADARDVELAMFARAAQTSADYALEHMLTALPVRQRKFAERGRFELLEEALGLAKLDGFNAEFGVFRGETLSFIADRIDKVVYGFDSFAGNPEPWFLQYGKGFFDLGGVPPTLAPQQHNTRLVNGPFTETLPVFTAQIAGPAAFLHLDCDLYSSTRTVLEGLADRIVPGTVILFGAYLNYPGWSRHAHRAFREFREARGLKWRYAAFAPAMFSVAVVIEG